MLGNTKAQQGFSLMEVIIVITLFALVLTVFLNIFDWSSSNYFYQEANVRVATAARQAVADMHDTTLESYRVLASQTVNGTAYSSGASSLVLQIPSIDSSGNVINNTWDYAAFYVSNGKLYKQFQANGSSSRQNTSKLLAENVSQLALTYNNADFTQVSEVDIDLTVSITVRGLVAQSRLQQEVHLRNH